MFHFHLIWSCQLLYKQWLINEHPNVRFGESRLSNNKFLVTFTADNSVVQFYVLFHLLTDDGCVGWTEGHSLKSVQSAVVWIRRFYLAITLGADTEKETDTEELDSLSFLTYLNWSIDTISSWIMTITIWFLMGYVHPIQHLHGYIAYLVIFWTRWRNHHGKKIGCREWDALLIVVYWLSPWEIRADV